MISATLLYTFFLPAFKKWAVSYISVYLKTYGIFRKTKFPNSLNNFQAIVTLNRGRSCYSSRAPNYDPRNVDILCR